MTRKSHRSKDDVVTALKLSELTRPYSNEFAQGVPKKEVFILARRHDKEVVPDRKKRLPVIGHLVKLSRVVKNNLKNSRLSLISPPWSKSAVGLALANEASSLVGQGQFSEAAKQWLTAFELSPTVLKYLDEAIYCYGLAGHFQRVVELLNTWESYSPQQSHRFSELAPPMIRFMAEKQVDDVQLENLINVAISILLQNQLPVLSGQFNLSLVKDEESQWYHYGIPVSDLSVDEIVKLDFELVNSLTKANLPVNVTGYFITLFEAFGVE